MTRLLVALCATLGLSTAMAAPSKTDFNDGIKVTGSKHTLRVWNSVDSQWQSAENFWLSYAKQATNFWGEQADYPPYAEVKEGDTVLIKVASGACLMEFFHSRWRRANDVRRWDDRFNAYGGCPRVFD